MIVPASVVLAAQKSQKKYGVYASVALAQYALESAWGKRMSGLNNPFGIKARPGQPGTAKMTWEVENGVRVNKTQIFANYDSIDDAFDAHGRLLATGSAYSGARAARSADAYADALTGHYATDPAYGTKLKSIMRQSGLYKYDTGAVPVVPIPSTVVVSKTTTPAISKPTKTVAASAGAVVVAGGTAVAAAHSLWPVVILGALVAIGVGAFFLIRKFKK